MEPPIATKDVVPDYSYLLPEMDKTLVHVVTAVETMRHDLARLSGIVTDQEQAIVHLQHQLADLAASTARTAAQWPSDDESWVKMVQELFGIDLTPAEQRVCGYLVRDPRPTRVAEKLRQTRSTVADHAYHIIGKFGLASTTEIPLYVCSHAHAAIARKDTLAPLLDFPAKRWPMPVKTTGCHRH